MAGLCVRQCRQSLTTHANAPSVKACSRRSNRDEHEGDRRHSIVVHPQVAMHSQRGRRPVYLGINSRVNDFQAPRDVLRPLISNGSCKPARPEHTYNSRRRLSMRSKPRAVCHPDGHEEGMGRQRGGWRQMCADERLPMDFSWFSLIHWDISCNLLVMMPPAAQCSSPPTCRQATVASGPRLRAAEPDTHLANTVGVLCSVK